MLRPDAHPLPPRYGAGKEPHFLGIKHPKHKDHHSPPSNNVQNEWSFASLPLIHTLCAVFRNKDFTLYIWRYVIRMCTGLEGILNLGTGYHWINGQPYVLATVPPTDKEVQWAPEMVWMLWRSLAGNQLLYVFASDTGTSVVPQYRGGCVVQYWYQYLREHRHNWLLVGADRFQVR
jgi:hypothetical protein